MKTITKDKIAVTLAKELPAIQSSSFGSALAFLIAQSGFVALMQSSGGFYRAHFGPAEAQAKDPLEALSLAFLKDKGYEVIE